MWYVGVDPGVGGAFAAVSSTSNDLWVEDMPTIEVRGKRRVDAYGVAQLVKAWDDSLTIATFVVEDVQGVQGSGATSAFAFGDGCGVIKGVLAAGGHRTVFVRPQVWTKALGVGSDKGAHRLMAQRLWPHQQSVFSRVKDDGRADAALIAHHQILVERIAT